LAQPLAPGMRRWWQSTETLTKAPPMPQKAPRPCKQAGCHSLTSARDGYCESHHAPHGWKHRNSRHDRGYGSKWQKTRKAALARDSHLCQACLRAGMVTPATDVDHITPKYLGGTDALDNLQCLCRECHKTKTAADKGSRHAGCDANGIPLAPNKYWSG